MHPLFRPASPWLSTFNCFCESINFDREIEPISPRSLFLHSEKASLNAEYKLLVRTFFSYRHEQQRHGLITDDGGDDNRDSYGYYKCRGPCSLVFATNVTRKR